MTASERKITPSKSSLFVRIVAMNRSMKIAISFLIERFDATIATIAISFLIVNKNGSCRFFQFLLSILYPYYFKNGDASVTVYHYVIFSM